MRKQNLKFELIYHQILFLKIFFIIKLFYSVLNFKLQLGQNQDIASPCSLNIIPKHLGHDPTSLINFPNAIPIQAFQKYKNNPLELDEHLHVRAKELLDSGKVMDGFKTLLSSTI